MGSNTESKSISNSRSSISVSNRSTRSKNYPKIIKSNNLTESGPVLVHIEKLNKDVTAEHLNEIFSKYGTVLKAFYLESNRKYTIRRFAFVQFENKAMANKAILYMNGGQINGREVTVSLAKDSQGIEPDDLNILKSNQIEKNVKRSVSRSRSKSKNNRKSSKFSSRRERRKKMRSQSSSSTKSIKEKSTSESKRAKLPNESHPNIKKCLDEIEESKLKSSIQEIKKRISRSREQEKIPKKSRIQLEKSGDSKNSRSKKSSRSPKKSKNNKGQHSRRRIRKRYSSSKSSSYSSSLSSSRSKS